MARARIIDAENEAPPEADRLGVWPHPRQMHAVYGHAGAEAAAIDAIASNRMHHGWLITGEEGIGKATFAYRFARFLLAQQEETLPQGVTGLDTDDDRVARQVANLSHPGLFVVRRAWDTSGKKFRQSIAVDEVRGLRHFLQRTSVTPWRAVVVDSADDLNPNSANAILKSLEEPPQRTVFLILSNAPGRLLPTIRSRCRLLKLEPLGSDDLARAVSDACEAAGHELPDAEKMRALTELARGSPRRALQLLEGDALAIAEVLMRVLASLPALDLTLLHKLVGLTGNRETEAYTTAFNLLEETLASLARDAALAETGARFPQLRSLRSLMTPDSLADWAELWETIREARGEAERLNLDKAALMLTVFDRIEQTAKAAAKRAGMSGR
jgi:DNA polymerase III subunit delta'